MVKDRALKLAEEALQGLVSSLEAGHSDTLKAYLAAMARFHTYSFQNSILIYFQRPAATQVAGFGKWKEMGRHVKKGEKGIAILAPVLYKAKLKVEVDEQDEQELRNKAVGFITTYVFDVAQTEGDDLPKFATVGGQPGWYKSRIRGLIQAHGIDLEYAEDLGGANGLSSGGKILIQEGMPAAQEFAVLVHELAHELMHKGERRQNTSKALRETEAEAVSFVVCSAIGLETGTAFSDYIQLWQGDAKLLSQSLAEVQHTAVNILCSIK